MKKPHTKVGIVLLAVFFVLTSYISLFTQPIAGQSINELRQRSAALQAEINAANQRAGELAREATSLRNTIASLDLQITQAQAQIDLTNLEVQKLERELANVEAELNRQRALLAASMRALYKRGGASAMELLVASDSFADFMNQQEHLERLKGGIQESTRRVVALKQEIQQKKEEQQRLLRQQEDARRSLADSKAERQRVLAATQGQEAEFRAYSRHLADQQREINRQLLALSRVVSVTGTGGYPWSQAVCVATGRVDGPCPSFEWYIGSPSNRLDPWNYFYRNCTSYVAWRSARMGLEIPWLGNGGQWANNAWRHPELSTGTTPRIGSFAVFTTGGYGHVAYVEDISGNEVLISEYNFVADGVHSKRWIPSNQPTRYVYTPWSR